MIKLKRIYEKSEKSDGFRILIDRLWPRGLRKEDIEIDLWLNDVGPSTDLRKWFAHDPKKWVVFKKKYETELKDKKEYLDEIISATKKHKTVTLLYGAKDEVHNQAMVVAEALKKMEAP